MAQKKAHEVDGFLMRLQHQFPVVLIYGPDKGLVSERAKTYAKLTGVPLDDPFANIRLEASDIDKDPARLNDEARTMSLFGGDRLIWLRNMASQKGLVDVIKSLIKEPPKQTFILIEAGDLKKGVGLRSAVEASATAMALPCFADDARALDGLIDNVLGEFQLNISLDARKWLRENLGGDRLVSRGELEKLCLYALKKKEITMDDVTEAVSNVSALSQDEIIDAVLVGNLSSFNDSFERQATSGSPLFLILSAAQRQFQQLQILRYQVEVEGKTPFSAVAGARPPIFFKRQKTVEKALNHWSLNQISTAMEKLQSAVLESRKNATLSESIIRQTLLALVIVAKRHGHS